MSRDGIEKLTFSSCEDGLLPSSGAPSRKMGHLSMTHRLEAGTYFSGLKQRSLSGFQNGYSRGSNGTKLWPRISSRQITLDPPAMARIFEKNYLHVEV